LFLTQQIRNPQPLTHQISSQLLGAQASSPPTLWRKGDYQK
jgi:hypothetical protein